jgi:enamine deaminase RidA (YjgF/YER057c/UK114 family)
LSPEEKLKQLGLTLAPVTPPIANYVNAVRAGNLLFLAGKGPAGGVTGIVGKEISVEQAYQHARTTGLALIAVMKSELGSLDKVKRIVKVLGMVNAVPGFGDQPKVVNGCSDLFVEVFGSRGKHARSAVGVGSLPNNIPVEIECILEVGNRGRSPISRRRTKKAAKNRPRR